MDIIDHKVKLFLRKKMKASHYLQDHEKPFTWAEAALSSSEDGWLSLFDD